MPQEISITDEDIQYAEGILLPDGMHFNHERKTFIQNFSTADLQAVPGSGKTTALLAKLLILERKLPFNNGSGILVLSHTNAAIDEIKDKIQKYCPKLFSYPNFIGTIQSFVDEFLAIPFYTQKYKRKPVRIDSEIYNERVKECVQKLWMYKFGFGDETCNKVAHIKNNNESLFYNIRFQYLDGTKLVKKLNGDLLEIVKPRGNTRLVNYQDYSQLDKHQVYKWFLKFKSQILKSGILHYDDAYFLAEVYLDKIPSIKTILQKRFSFVFVDEMQDMDSHQYNLLEKIFYDLGNSISKIQRIGDKNQSIYNSVKSDEIWINRQEVLRLSESQRLSQPIANVVKKFALYADENFDIIGLHDCDIKPHLLIFENETVHNIIPFFSQIIKEFKDHGRLISEKGFKVICWNTDWKEDQNSRNNISKLRLEDYYRGYQNQRIKQKKDYECLKNYLLFYDKNKKTLEPLRKNILNFFLKLLRLENIKTTVNIHYTKKKLLEFFKENYFQMYEEFNLNIYNWSIDIIKGEIDDVFNEIKLYAPIFFSIFSENQLITSLAFINNDIAQPEISTNADNPLLSNQYIEEGIEIGITSVHAVKGQTHCATLYLESYFQKDGNGPNAKSYESQRLAEQFLGNLVTGNAGERVKQSLKMAYVGFSRPTDLLCIGIHKNRFDNFLSDIDRNEWEIKNVPTTLLE